MGYRTERIFVLATILLVGLGLTLAVSRGALGGEQGSSTVLLWTMTIALMVVAAAGSVWLRSGASAVSSAADTNGTARDRRFAWPIETVVPALLVGGFTLFVQLFENGIVQALILALAAVSFGAIYWAQVHSFDVSDRFFSGAQAMLNVLSHLCAFLLFATIYGLKTRSAISATAVAIVTALLVYELLSRDAVWHRAMSLPVEGRRQTIMLLSLVSGLVLGELTWGLNYWAALTTLVGAAFLLVAFYVLYGLVSHYVDHRLDRQTFLEFGLVGLVGVLAVFASAFFVTI
ncbi:MAG: hypothetical protein ABI670_00615 [Chloroflexota bacterium]